MATKKTGAGGIAPESLTTGFQITGGTTTQKVLTVPLDATVSGVNTGDQNLAAYAPLASPTFTGTPVAPTAAVGTNTTQIASTAFVQAALAQVCQFRLTLTGGTPVTTADVASATTIYLSPYGGNHIGLYDGANWEVISSAEVSLALGTLSNATPYDVFAYNNAGTLTLEFLAWTNGTTRSTGLVLQDGVLVKTGATTRRYVGTFYTISTTQTQDSGASGAGRLLWNYYNRVRKPLKVYDATDSWTANAASTWEYLRNQSTAVTKIVVGWAESLIELQMCLEGYGTVAYSFKAGIGRGGTTNIAQTTQFATVPVTNYNTGSIARLIEMPAIGYQYYSALEWANSTTLITFYGDGGVTADALSAMIGSIDC